MQRIRAPRGWRPALALVSLTLLSLTAAGSAAPAAAQTSAGESSMNTSKQQVRIGNRVVIRGWFQGAADAPVQIQRRAPNGEHWRNARRTTTGPKGGYRVTVAPRRTWRWRALLIRTDGPVEGANPDDDATAARTTTASRHAGPARVRVRSRTRARVVNRHVRAGQRTRVSGRVRPDGRRRVIVRVGGRDRAVRTGPEGRFNVRIAVPRPGIHRVRVRARGNARALASRTRAGQVTGYRAVGASWYGPGFYGGRTACGQTLTTSTVGTAHRTLPCGTRLRLRYGGRTVTVPVIDRGPFVSGRELDLTYATKRRLGFGSTGTVLMSR